MDGAEIIFVCKDLFFTSKVTGVAKLVHRRVRIVGDVEQAIAATNERTPFAILDLSNAATWNAESIGRWRERLSPGVRLLAFGSHVDVETLRKARSAGCDPVLPRSEFTNRLAELLEEVPEEQRDQTLPHSQ